MRNFSFYFKKGSALTKMALKGKGVFTKLALGLYLILSFFGKMFLFLRPIFLIADSNLAMMIVEAHDFEINKLFEGINSRKRYTSLLLANLYIEGIMLIASVVFVAPFAIWQAIPLFYNQMVPPVVFAILGGVVVMVISIMLALAYAPMGFVATKGRGLSAGDVLYLSNNGSKGIKGKVFWTNFLNYFVITLVMAAFFLSAYLFILFLRDGNQAMLIVNFIVLFILIGFIFVDIFLLSHVRLRNLISLYALFFDSVETKHIVVTTRGATPESFVPLFADDKEEE